jgi:hypothetical protein
MMPRSVRADSRTVFGRDFHRPSTPAYGGTDVPQREPAAHGFAPAVPVANRPIRSGKSGFPARAGFWGRRNSHGEIVPLTDPQMRLSGGGRWRAVVLPHAAVVVASALLSFGAVMAVMKLREPREQGPPGQLDNVRPRAVAPVSTPALPPPVAVPPAPPPVTGQPGEAAPAPRPPGVLSDEVLEPLDWGQRAQPKSRAKTRLRPTKGLPRRGGRSDPDGTLAPSFD